VSIFSFLTVYSQENFSKFYFSGYRVVVIPEETFQIKIINNFDAIQEVTQDGVLRYAVKDQNGRVPKDTLYLYTNEIKYMQLHNSELVMNTPLQGDSLTVGVTSAFGKLNVDTKFLKINAVAGSRFSVKGMTLFLNCSVGAGSHVNARELEAKQSELNVMGYSSLTINSEEIIKEDINENSHFRNVYVDK
jgi:hypothetical protein